MKYDILHKKIKYLSKFKKWGYLFKGYLLTKTRTNKKLTKSPDKSQTWWEKTHDGENKTKQNRTEQSKYAERNNLTQLTETGKQWPTTPHTGQKTQGD